jgi:hypothetical protein
VIPSHFSTAVFSTCNVKFWHFAVATFLTLPKQIVIVYLGVLLAQNTPSDSINDIVLGITFVVTLIAGVYVYLKMRTAKKVLLEEQAARQSLKRTLSDDSVTSTQRRPQESGVSHTPIYDESVRGAYGHALQRGEEAYEMEYTQTRGPTKMAEFI